MSHDPDLSTSDEQRDSTIILSVRDEVLSTSLDESRVCGFIQFSSNLPNCTDLTRFKGEVYCLWQQSSLVVKHHCLGELATFGCREVASGVDLLLRSSHQGQIQQLICCQVKIRLCSAWIWILSTVNINNCMLFPNWINGSWCDRRKLNFACNIPSTLW